MLTYQQLRKNLKKDFSGLRVVRLALLGDSATQMYAQAIRGYGFEVSLNIEVFEADYNQIERQIFDPESELYRFRPEVVVIFKCTRKLMQRFGNCTPENRFEWSQTVLGEVQELYETLLARLHGNVLFCNFPELDDAVFGHYANKTNASFLYQLRTLNWGLMNLAQKLKNLHILDFNVLQSRYGYGFITDTKIYVNTELYLSIDFLPIAARHTVDVLQSLLGKFKKCLILDLDNTLWGGIIGDDGMENIQLGDLGIGKAFTELQLWAKQLKQRGIILAVCSKNDEAVAREPFEKHPDMVLRLDDIAVFVASWNNKADSIMEIQQILNIGFDSMVFLDDNPFERNMVRTHIPAITVPELPDDPAEYMDYLRTLNLFETASFTRDDDGRTEKYQQEARREGLKKQFTNETEFLKSLNMVAAVEPFNAFNTPRVAQLTQRSNQFNLRTIRYTEEDIQQLANDPDCLPLSFTLEDKYGDYGLISTVILRKHTTHSAFIDTWIMSCRVLKRSMEHFVLNTLVNRAAESGFTSLVGEYIATPKNAMVEDHFQRLGFRPEGSFWTLLLKDYQPKECYITPKIHA